ncbi:MAG: S-layer homology domain-containing protein [Oscillospiraceae bacterium]|nr:S-layer homology domain-containing protein [Oscillospiraceae bacterium]
MKFKLNLKRSSTRKFIAFLLCLFFVLALLPSFAAAAPSMSASQSQMDFGKLQTSYDRPDLKTIVISYSDTNYVNYDVSAHEENYDIYIGTISSPTSLDGNFSLTVHPKDGLPVGVYDCVITINGTGGASVPVNVKFEVTAAATPKPITIQAIRGLTPPVVFASPVSTITAETQFTGSVTWKVTSSGAALSSSGSFAPSTAYTATVTLTPASGYTLTGLPADFFTVQGATSVRNTANSGVITVNFPATASGALSSGSFTVRPRTNTTYFFTVSDFTSVLTPATANLTHIRIDSLPSATYGTLYLGGTSTSNKVTSGQVIARSEIPQLRFVPAGVTGSTSFQYRSGTSNSSFSSSAGTVTVTVSDTDTSLKAGDFKVTTPVNTNYSFKIADFTDAFTAPSGSLSHIRITQLPSSSHGELYYSNTRVVVNQEIARNDITNLSFRPVSNYNGSATFRYTVSSTTDPTVFTTNSGIVTVTVGNTASLTGGTKTTQANTTLSFTLKDFTDLYTSGGSLTGITITALPTSGTGTLYLSGVPVSRNDYILASRLQNLTFVPASGYTGSASFSFTATDGTYTTSAATMTIYIGSSAASSVPRITSFRITEDYVRSRTVNCTISAVDSSYGAPSQYAISVNGGTYGTWQNYATSFQYSLPSAEGTYRLSVKVRNTAGRESAPAFDIVVYDYTPPKITAAVISADRRTVAVDFDEEITAHAGTSVLRDAISFGGGNYADSVTISGATLSIRLSSALGLTTRLYIDPDVISDLAGNVASWLEADIKEMLSYSISGVSSRSATVTLPAGTSSAANVDSLTMSGILADINMSGGTLNFVMSSSGSTASQSLSLPLSLFSSDGLKKVSDINVRNSSAAGASVNINAAWAGDALKKFGSSFTVNLTGASVTDHVSGMTIGESRGVSLKVGNTELTSFSDRNAVTLNLPYNLGSTNADKAVIMKRTGSGAFTPLFSSRYNAADGTIRARITEPGTYVAAINVVNFSDVPATQWANSYITSLSCRKVIEGMTGADAGKFLPSGTLTRAEYIKLLVTSLDLYDENKVCSYSDVAPNNWFYHYVTSAVAAGILSDSAGEFAPNTPITRQDMCLFAYLARTSAKINFTSNAPMANFTDQGSIQSQSLTAVRAMQASGIIAGYPDGTFKPLGSTTRAEAAKIIFMIMALQDI